MLRELTCHMEPCSIACYPPEMTFLLLLKLIKAGIQFSDPGWTQGWVDQLGLVTYEGGLPAFPVITGLNMQ